MRDTLDWIPMSVMNRDFPALLVRIIAKAAAAHP